MALNPTITKRLMLARYLFGQAEDNAKSHREVASFAAINMLQDAIEIFFLAAADHLNAKIERRTEFDQYIDKINEKLPEPLPFRQRLVEINKVRVLSKHNGVAPNATELKGYLGEARQFFEEVCQTIFGKAFWTVSLIDLLPDGETWRCVTAAEEFYQKGQYRGCLVECRKAIFIEVEHSYVIDSFKDGEGHIFVQAVCKAPQYTRSKQFIEEYVHDPFDYVRLDHDRVDAELLRDGIQPEVFWNIWRLTPAVYRNWQGRTWMVKEDLEIYDEAMAEQSAGYVLEQTIDILLKKAKTRSSFLKMEADINYVSQPKNGQSFKVYRKADKNSDVVGEVPGTAERVWVKYRTPGLVEGFFWRISFMDGLEDGVGPGVDVAFVGYADENDLALSS
jgi:hypothetical protein